MYALRTFFDNRDVIFPTQIVIANYPRSNELLILQIPVNVILYQSIWVVVNLVIKRANRVLEILTLVLAAGTSEEDIVVGPFPIDVRVLTAHFFQKTLIYTVHAIEVVTRI